MNNFVSTAVDHSIRKLGKSSHVEHVMIRSPYPTQKIAKVQSQTSKCVLDDISTLTEQFANLPPDRFANISCEGDVYSKDTFSDRESMNVL